MPRKKSVSGRARGVTAVNRIMIQTERINKQLRRLEKAGRYGTYKSKELIRFVQQTPQLSIKKSRGSKRHRVAVNKIKMTTQQFRLINKKLRSFLQSEAFYVSGIERIEKKIRKKIVESVSENLGRRATKQELEQFYDILNYRMQHDKESLLNKIEPSAFQDLVNNMVTEKTSKKNFVKELGKYVEINNEDMRKEAESLYYKFVKNM